MRLRAWLTARRSEIFIIALFYLLCFGIFGERFWFFSNQIEHVGIRRVVQWSVPVTRGCAPAMLFAGRDVAHHEVSAETGGGRTSAAVEER